MLKEDENDIEVLSVCSAVACGAQYEARVMKIVHLAIVLAMCLITLTDSHGLCAQETAAGVVEPDPDTQRLLREVLQSPPNADEAELWRKINELTKRVGDDIPGFIQQAVLYEAKQRREGGPFSLGWTSL